jgi:hypothetical protein
LADRKQYWLLYLAGLLFAGFFCWSVWFETMAPLLHEGDYWGVLFHLIGIPIILAGTAAIVYGGFLIVRNTFSLMADEEIQRQIAIIRQKPSSEARRAAQRFQIRYFAQAWRAGALWMAAGFGLIAAGGFIINS